jgi:hypothetical protein
MKASELRIGNFYDHNGFVNEVNPNTIEEAWIAERSWIKPIPITEVWLWNFGFEINRQNKEENNIWRCYSEEGFFELEQIGSGFFLDDNHCYGTKINYIHQLQNLYFALTGEELKKQAQ